jgi:hypothetical protein
MTIFRWIVLAGAVAAGLNSPAFAQRDAVDILKGLNFNRQHKRLPLWHKTSSEASQQLSKTARTIRDALMVVGHPDVGFATGFVISRANRLVATNAHVADLQAQLAVLYAVRNGTTDQYEVDTAYYHPALVRVDPKGVLTQSSPNDPGTGTVFAFSPDVAVLRLKPGPPLPAEVSFATPEEIQDLWSLPVGMAGYPGTETTFPVKGHIVAATFHDGAIEHVSTFNRDVSPDNKNNQMVEYTMSTWGGFSGAPVFLENGHIVAINNSHQTFHSGDMSTTQTYGVRIDCLWELLQHDPALAKLVPGTAKVDQAQMDRDVNHPPKADQKEQEALKLLDAADYKTKTTSQQLQTCSQAIAKAPKLAYAFAKRGVVYMDMYYKNLAATSPTDRYALLQSAANDFDKAQQLDPNSVDSVLQLCQIAYLQRKEQRDAGQDADFKPVVKHIDEVLAMSSLSLRQHAVGLQIRAFCTGPSATAERDLDDAVKLLPMWSDNYGVRADYYANLALQPDKATADRALQKQILDSEKRAVDAKNRAVKWKQEKSTDASVIQGAVADASAACAATEWKEWRCLDSLVHVYETKGDYDMAIHWAVEARKVAPDVAQEFHSVSDVYECRQETMQGQRPR